MLLPIAGFVDIPGQGSLSDRRANGLVVIMASSNATKAIETQYGSP